MQPSTAAPEASVFINCPYDTEYLPILQAIILGVVCCGFIPRSAVSSLETSKLRLQRILDELFRSHYSIHDLSRCKGEGDEGLARFNMPLELGMAVARRHPTPENHRDILVLVPKGHDYARYISDLAGIDPREHDHAPAVVLKRVMAWLQGHAKATQPVHPPPLVEARLDEFAAQWKQSVQDWGEANWWKMVDYAAGIAESL